jgi:hypothetical protein
VAEQYAEAATKLSAFPINLHKVRDQVRLILTDWKIGGFFEEFTDHSFNHVHDMLEDVEWLIPTETKSEMTPGDWFMIVLSIYFHDIGLLITKDEYENRYKDSDYKAFLENPLLPAEKQNQYLAKLASMPADMSERLKFQEYVRHTHGKRVRGWLEGKSTCVDAYTPMRKVVEDLVKPLEQTVRRDLALLCESHTLNNIENVNVFKTSQPYGSEKETVNLQYCAVILRTVDLIQITRKRTPGVLYQLINPSDPQSQLEWQKQSAVRTVRAALGRDREGHVSKSALSDTIEVHATFNEPNGFFGLTSYLLYAQSELVQSHNAIQKSQKNVIKNYTFPWKTINTDNIDTEGFLTDSFEFELDQHKILDLLTGHTLYNDTTVVLRELTQNALDAVRLQADIEGKKSEDVGHVSINWNSADRSLTISDNGTGMTQDVIISHLLKVGSSRYQDLKFKEKHPNFHSISRFGIGVLSAFMVSDDVEITTCSEEEDQARRIALRSVHGKYLIKLLDKVSDRDSLPMYPHGTAVKIILRPTAKIGDILRVARSWLVFPRCRVTVSRDGEPPVSIGFSSPKDAIESYLTTAALQGGRTRKEYDVKEFSQDGITLAFAIAKDKLFNDWSFAEAPRPRPQYSAEEDENPAPIGTCVEGVTVEMDTPGFRGRTFFAVANAVGSGAPKTNVARSAIEDTLEQREMLQTIYTLYSRHVTEEIARMASTESHSLSRAVGFAPWLASPLLSGNVSKPALLAKAMAKVPLVLVENDKVRENISFEALSKYSEFWTVESPLYRSVEYFVKEAPADVTANKILSTLGNQVGTSSKNIVLCNLTSSFVDQRVKEAFEISEVVASQERRQIELRWKKQQSSPNWLSSRKLYELLLQRDQKFFGYVHEARERLRSMRNNTHFFGAGEPLHVPQNDFANSGLEDSNSFIVNRERYLKWDTPLTAHFLKLNDQPDSDRSRALASHFVICEALRNWGMVSTETIRRTISNFDLQLIEPYLGDLDVFADALTRTGSETFDPFAWDRREAQETFGWAG